MLIIAVAAAASFGVGAYANQVFVGPIQSIAGNHVLVPAPELRILSSLWNINLRNSTITAVTLNVTTVGVAGVTGFKLYQIFVQVSCLNLPPSTSTTEFTCATGTTTIVLPVNLNGTSVTLPVTITPPIDPEIIEVHDLSFIVTGSPTTVTAPTFQFQIFNTLGPGGSMLPLTTVNVTDSRTLNVGNTALTALIISQSGFSGTVNLNAVIAPSVSGGPTVFTQVLNTSPPPPFITGTSTTVASGATVSTGLIITITTTTALGSYVITDTACGGTPIICHSITVNLTVTA